MICVSPVRRKVRRGKPTENGLEFHFSTKKRFASQVRSQETSPGRKGGGWRRKKGEGGRRKQKKMEAERKELSRQYAEQPKIGFAMCIRSTRNMPGHCKGAKWPEVARASKKCHRKNTAKQRQSATAKNATGTRLANAQRAHRKSAAVAAPS